MRFACWIIKATHTHTHTHRICNTYCFPTATIVNTNAPQCHVMRTFRVWFGLLDPVRRKPGLWHQPAAVSSSRHDTLMQAQMGGGGVTPTHNLALGVGGQPHALATSAAGKTRCPLYRRLGGPRDRSRRHGKSRPHQDSTPRTVQPAATRYSDCAVPATALVSPSSDNL
jgi:hypothetical protein